MKIYFHFNEVLFQDVYAADLFTKSVLGHFLIHIQASQQKTLSTYALAIISVGHGYA